MGREIHRVALDFDWPVKKVWEGFEELAVDDRATRSRTAKPKQKLPMKRMLKKKPRFKVRPSEDVKLVSSETIQHFLDTYSLIEVLIRCSREDIITDDGVLFDELVGLLSDNRHERRHSKELFERILAAKAHLTFHEEEF